MAKPHVQIVEVGPRDGLQNEKVWVPTATKIAFIDALSQSGLTSIEVSAFVSAQWIPQLADADEVFSKIKRNPSIIYSALVPNVKGLERALKANVQQISIFTAASETFNQKNINTSIAGSFQRFIPVVEQAKQLQLLTRGYISTAFWCPYEGYIQPQKTVEVAKQLLDLGIDEISIGDTIGKATPNEVKKVLDALLSIVDAHKIAMHFHDTYGRAIANILTSYDFGVRIFDSSVGGLGGCPYAPGAKGNVNTASVITALQNKGAETSIDLKQLAKAYEWIAPCITG